MMFEGYCVKGRHKVKVNGKEVVIKGRRFMVGTCPVHGVKVYRIVGKAGGSTSKSSKGRKKAKKSSSRRRRKR